MVPFRTGPSGFFCSRPGASRLECGIMGIRRKRTGKTAKVKPTTATKVRRRVKRRRLNAASLLPQVIRQLVTTESDLLLDEICRLARTAMGADEVDLFLMEPDGKTIREHEVAGRKLRATRHRLQVHSEGVAGWVAGKKRPCIISDVRKNRRYIPTDPGMRSEAAVPIWVGKQVVGVLNFESRHPGFFHKNDLVLLRFLAARVAIALRMTELHRRARRWQEWVAAINNIARLGGGVVPSETMFRRVADAVRLECGGEYAGIFRADYEKEMLMLVAQSGDHIQDDATEGRIRFGTGILGRAFAIGEVVNVRDVRNDPMYFYRVPGVLSQICMPIRVGDRPVGMLDVQAATVGEFTEDEVMFLDTVARLLAPQMQAAVPAV